MLVMLFGTSRQVTKKGVSANAEEIDICKHREMLMNSVKDSLEILSKHQESSSGR